MAKIKNYLENPKAFVVLNIENTLSSLIIIELDVNYWSKFLRGIGTREVCYLKLTYTLIF